jgi:Na+-transporting methylmalonyl-CoA/oxaloacetate decarboxylase gamma subunit
MLQFGGPLAIVLGIATVIAVLIILALRWRGRSED